MVKRHIGRHISESMGEGIIGMKFENVYFINGTAYAGKSTMVKALADKYDGIACEENYHDALVADLNSAEFPNVTYTRDLTDWREFIRRTPDEYEAWIQGCIQECTILELKILEEVLRQGKKVFVDTNIPTEVLWSISDIDHVLIMLADPDVSVNRFFDRPDREKQFLYQLLWQEANPNKALENFRECLRRINSKKCYNRFLNSGFHVMVRDESRTIEESLLLAETAFRLRERAKFDDTEQETAPGRPRRRRARGKAGSDVP